jgi:hypothetical protein
MSSHHVGIMLSVFAGTALSLTGATMAQHTAPAKGLALTPANPLPTMPLRVAGAMQINGELVLTTEWMDYRPGNTDVVPVPVFDCFEVDATGVPTGFCTSCNNANAANCPPTGGAGPGSRWSYNTSNTAWTVNDMTMAPGFNGAMATRLQFAWGWGPASAQCFVAVFTYEDFVPCGTVPPATGGFPGVVFDFGVIAGGTTAPYHWTDVDLAAMSLPMQLPMDGSGAYEILIGSSTNPFVLSSVIGTRPMLWGTGEDEVPADPRAGTQTSLQWDDAGPQAGGVLANGVLDPATECWSYQFAGFCPGELGSMVLFYAEPGGPAPCYANCDQSTTPPVLNVGDFTCFLQQFAAGNSYANCDQSTTPPVLNVGDFTCFLQRFASGCP